MNLHERIDCVKSSNEKSCTPNFDDMSLEELVVWLQENESDEALEKLFDEMKAAVKTIMFNFYPAFLPTYDIEDMYQEANIAMWKAIKNYKPGHGWKAKSFMELVVKRRFIRIHESYYSKNPFILYSTKDDYTEEGLIKAKPVMSGFRQRNLEKKREWNNKWRIKHGLKPTEPRVKKTPQEIKEHERAKSRQYYAEHKEEIKARYRNRTPEQIAEQKRKRHERYMKNREVELLQVKMYRESHPEKAREYARRSTAKKRAKREAEQEGKGTK